MSHLRYLRYVLRHRWFVFLACCALGVPIRGLVHDLSKFRPSEWIPYAAYFYGPAERKQQTKPAFLAACQMHYRRNPHHPEYWKQARRRSPAPMPRKYVLEMVADWTGAGRAINGRKDWRPWYRENARTIGLHPETRAMVEEMFRAPLIPAGCAFPAKDCRYCHCECGVRQAEPEG